MARDQYQALLTTYASALDWAVREAEKMRAQRFERLKERFEGDVARASEALKGAGPLYVSPYIIGAVRKYWLACQALNEKEPAAALQPATFILDRLREKRADLADLVGQFPYWPVGITADGRWI